MTRIVSSLLSIIITLLCSLTEANAGAWTRKQGSYYAKLGFTTLSTNTFHTKDGDEITTADFNTWSFNFYGEYGITESLTGIAKFPFLRNAGFETTESFTGIGDLSIGLRYGLVAGSTPVAVGILIDFPTGNENGSGTLKELPTASVRLPTGDGELNTQLNFSLSHSFYPAPAFVSLDGGYNVRTEGFTDEYLFAVQGGYKIIEKLWLQANLRGIGPISTPDPTLAGGTALGFGEGVQYTAYSFGASYEIAPRLNVSFDLFSAFGRITNIYSGINYVLGISIES